ncbi:MAG: glycosyltransferase family 4 protein [Candidatus Riflebacteria bacterium]|nr:glycosyltransferase family 4 protein [Candidatus Riflebacteria bacterium]
MEWLAARSSPTQIVLSRLQGDRLVRLLGVHPDRVEVVGRGIHAGDTAPRQEVPGRVLHAGRLIPYKNVETVVKAFPRVRARLPEAHLRIIGDGPSLEAIGALIDRLGAGAYVEVVPPVASGDRILAELASAQVLVQPSLREGQGLIVLEAMQLGTPVVAARSASSAVVDVVEHEVNGLLVDRPLEPGSWADALVGLLHDRARRERLATAARATAAPFDWQVIVTRLLEVYRRACARG